MEKITIKIPNVWFASTFILALVLLIFLFFPSFLLSLTGKGITGLVVKTLSPDEVGQKSVDYINNNLVQVGSASLISVEEFSGIYRVLISYQGQQIPVYVTKDGSYLFLSQPLDTSKEIPKQQEAEQQPQQAIDEKELAKFIDCLKNSDFKIYGANWCGWTVRLVTMLGGFEMVRPIYIECTEQQEECEKAGITGYPTIFIKGKRYQGERTFKAFSDATGCPIPAGAEKVQSSPSTGGC